MSPHSLPTLRRLQGRHVAVALFDGTRLDDCELVSVGRGSGTLWLLVGDDDRIVPVDHVVDVVELA
jgi:hypothetical protein